MKQRFERPATGHQPIGGQIIDCNIDAGRVQVWEVDRRNLHAD